MADDTRPFSDAERRALELYPRRPALSRPGVADRIVVSCMGAGCLTMIAYAVLAGGLALIGKAVDLRKFKGNDHFGLVMFVLPFVLWIGTLIVVFTRRPKPPPGDPDLKTLVERDLKGGVARILRFRATEVLLAYGNRRRDRNYFVRLEDGRILYLGTENGFAPDEKGFPSREFEIVVAPESLVVLDVIGSGEYLRPSDEFDLSTSNPLRLVPGTFTPMAWEDLRKTYG